MITFFTLLLTACACFGQLIIRNQAPSIAPSISTQPTNQTILTNQNASFTVVATGTPTLYYQWQTNSVNAYDGGRISGSTTTQLTFTAATIADSNTLVRCIITNSIGSITSDVATLTVTNGVASTNFLPSDIATLGGWYVYTNYYTNGSTATLPDLSGNGRELTQTTSSYMPSTNSDGLIFGNDTSLSKASITNTLPIEVWVVCNITNRGGNELISAINRAEPLAATYQPGSTRIIAYPSAVLSFTNTNTWMVLSYFYSAAGAGNISFNNGTTNTSGTVTVALKQIDLGDSLRNSPFWGAIKEVVVYTNLNSGADKLKIYQYMTNRWGFSP
jgi:hypothetical protein